MLIDPPFRKVTFKLLGVIVCNFCYNKKQNNCLIPYHYEVLAKAYIISIQHLKRLFARPALKDIFFDLFEEEWKKFKFVD